VRAREVAGEVPPFVAVAGVQAVILGKAEVAPAFGTQELLIRLAAEHVLQLQGSKLGRRPGYRRRTGSQQRDRHEPGSEQQALHVSPRKASAGCSLVRR